MHYLVKKDVDKPWGDFEVAINIDSTVKMKDVPQKEGKLQAQQSAIQKPIPVVPAAPPSSNKPKVQPDASRVEQELKPPPGEVSCPHCTTFNSNKETHCSMCGLPLHTY